MPERLPRTRTVDLGRFQHILGHRLQPGEQHDHDKGIETQASIASMLKRAIQGDAKNAGSSHPRWRASVAAGPKRYSMSDLPIIQLTATGLSISGSRKTTRKNFRARISAFSSRASPNATAYSPSTATA